VKKNSESNEQQENTGRSEIDPIFKVVICSKFGQLGIPVKTQVEVSRLPRTIDVVLTLELENDLIKVRLETPFYYVRTHNQIEFVHFRSVDNLRIPTDFG